MSETGNDPKPICLYRTSLQHLLECYSPKKTNKGKKSDCLRLPWNSLAESNPLPILRPSVTRHTEQRLRPQTCTACRMCVNVDQRGSERGVVTGTSLLPLDKLNHLPYQSGRTEKRRNKERHRYRVTDKSPCSRTLISCHLRQDSNVQGPNVKCKSRLLSRHSGSSESKSDIVTDLPAGTGSELVLTSAPHSHHLSGEELRTWIVQFGGDEQAAFMARGLQRLRLAYEQGRAEMAGLQRGEWVK
ncbi:hypothetical protein GDO86_010728 [Hymenochirus boettgeri]|uniref:Uncharacterized protein n=1 Tax=Hymenochirus boettgeri TaxID=247094 RepID=A0A8T2JBC1_9PIPI|nr:hypothetical protein GDO86_010728 [Hymenochirus boettgeri]KAG8441653.1 hypothetical protein GDO86_010728 [Hymenochirus boettgeri]